MIPPSAPPRRITWLIQGDEVYGVRQAVLSLALAVRDGGWDVRLATLMAGPFADECRRLGFPVADLGAGPAPAFSGGLPAKAVQFVRLSAFRRRAARALAGRLRADAVDGWPSDALHVLWPNLVSVAGAAACDLDVPCFWEMPNVVSDRYPFGINRRIYQSQCRRYGVVPLANSRYTAATLGHHPVRTRVMHLGVDPRRFDPAAVRSASRAELNIPTDAIVLGVLARLDPSKGQDRLLRAMLSLGHTDAPIHLLLLGGPEGGAFADELRRIAAGASAADRLHLRGAVSDPERYYPVIDVPVNCRVDPEPYGLSVVEAMMMGRPVLAHAAGGPAETIVDGTTGWLVADPSVESLAAGLRRALADRARWPAMRRASREHALAHFTIERQAQFYRDTVEEVLRER